MALLDKWCSEDPSAGYEEYKAAGYYDQIECQYCDITIDRYLHKAHESLCERKKSRKVKQ